MLPNAATSHRCQQYRAKHATSLERFPLHVERRNDVTLDGHSAFQDSERAPLCGHEFRHRPALLGYDDAIAGASTSTSKARHLALNSEALTVRGMKLPMV
jgi:hypothetical protein